MTIKEKYQWRSQRDSLLDSVITAQRSIRDGSATSDDYYFFVGTAVCYAIELYIDGDLPSARSAAKIVMEAILEYFYGEWRFQIPTDDGIVDANYWRKESLWFDEVMKTLPFALALNDWAAVQKIAEYPPEDSFPEAGLAKGEAALGWALVYHLRAQTREASEFLAEAEKREEERLQLLCRVLKAIIQQDAQAFSNSFLLYMKFYKENEIEMKLTKLISVYGTIMYHLGHRQGFFVQLPVQWADHVIRL